MIRNLYFPLSSEVLGPEAKTPEDVMDKLPPKYRGDEDPSERLLTRLLLSAGACHLSPKNLAWKYVGLESSGARQSPSSDFLRCFHGFEWEPCDADGSHDGDDDGCLWWRAGRHLGVQGVRRTFEEIRRMPL